MEIIRVGGTGEKKVEESVGLQVMVSGPIPEPGGSEYLRYVKIGLR